MDLAYYVVSLSFFKLLFVQTSILGGWSEPQVMVFVGGCLLIDALQMTTISSNLWELPSMINQGDIDYYIVKPVSSLFVLSFREFAANSFVNLIIAAGIFIWALRGYPEPISAWRLLVYLVLLLNGFFLYYMVRLLATIPVFWLQSPWGLERIFYSLLPFMERPHTIFRGPVRSILLTVLPFSLIVSIPAKVFFEGMDLETLLHITAVTAGFFSIVLFLWNKGLRSYSSASS